MKREILKSKTSQVALALILIGLVSAPSTRVSAQQNEQLDRLFDEDELDDSAGTTFNPAPPNIPAPPVNAQDFSTTPPPAPPTSFTNDTPSNGISTGPRQPIQMNGKDTKRLIKKGDKNHPSMADANIEDITDENYPDLIESFDYPNADIADLAKAISQLTGKNFILDSTVHGKISIVAPTQITVAEAYKAFLTALATNNFTVVPSGKFLKIMSTSLAQRSSIETYSGQYFPTSDILITRIVRLKYTSAEEVQKNLRNLNSRAGEMTPYPPTNALIITDLGSNIERIMKILNEIDQPGFEEQLKVIPIRYAPSGKLADMINQIINKEPNRGGSQGGFGAPGFGAGVPRFRSRGGTANGGTPEDLSLVTSDDRTNSIIVVGNKSGIEKVRELVRKLDYKLDPAEAGGVFVYYVKYGDAEKIGTTLQGIATGGAAGGGAQPGGLAGGFPGRAVTPLSSQTIFGGDVKISADKATNSLVVTASKQDWEVVQSILAKIDIRRDQVFVEAILMEMNTEKQRSWNPVYYYLDPSSNGIGRSGFSGAGNLASTVDPTGDSGTILGFGSGSSLNFTIGGKQFVVPSLLAFIKLIQANVESNILSTPRILALDNEQSEIEVGDNIPISQDSTTTAAGTQQSTHFDKATIKLTITPYIRPDTDVVRLKLDQSVKQPSDTTIASTTLAATTTIISDRHINTNLVVRSGDTAVLGGLNRDQDSVQEQKVPILGDIPVVGWLFKSSTIKKKKLDLVVFLTPKIIRDTKDSHQLLSKEAKDRVNWIKSNFSGRDPYGSKIDNFPRAAENDEEISNNEGISRTNRDARKSNPNVKSIPNKKKQ
jgi:general secretion pathway protein D